MSGKEVVNSGGGQKPVRDYWIKGGLQARLKGGYGPVMTVMRVLEVRRKLRSGEVRNYIEGVLCTFKDPFDGRQVKKRFHTRALEPYRQ